MEVVLYQLFEPLLVKLRLILSFPHGSPPKVSLVPKVEYCKPYRLFLRALESIKPLLYALNLVFESLGAGSIIVNRWVMAIEPLEHVGIVLLYLLFLSPYHLL